MTPTATALLGMSLDAIRAEVDRRIVADRVPADAPILADLAALYPGHDATEVEHAAALARTRERTCARGLTATPTGRSASRARLHDEQLRHEVFAILLIRHAEANDATGTPSPAFVRELAVVLDAWPSTPPRVD